MRFLMVATMAVAVLVASPATHAELQPGAPAVGSATVVPIQVTGDPAARFNLVVLGDGYTAADMPKFRAHLDRHLNIMWSLEPFRSYRSYFNVYAVEIVSADSGITCDPEIRQQRNTPLRLQFGGGCTNINARGVTVGQGAQQIVREYAMRATPNPDQILIIANSDTYGGIGGALATTTGGNAISPLITPHEIGHSLGGLTDEYTYSARGRPGGPYTREGEPPSIHMTLLTTEEMRTQQKKWWRWLGEPSESGGLIDRFEGGNGSTTGVWRPSKHSMMISLGYYFDQVSRERMTQRIAERTGLIAASTPTEAPVKRTTVLWVDVAHPVYHELGITWKVGDRVIDAANNKTTLDLTKIGLTASEQTVSVTVVDPTEFVRDPVIRERALTATKTWTVSAATGTPDEQRLAVLQDRGLARDPRNPLGFVFFPTIAQSTQTIRPIGGSDVVYLELTRPDAPPVNPTVVMAISWALDGRSVPEAAGRLTFPLAPHKLTPGTHTLTVSVGLTGGREQPAQRTWQIDNTPPTVAYTFSSVVATMIAPPGGEPHYFARDEFTMKLEPKDDQPGYLVAEFRVNGDGWHHYYGWPDAPPGTPFKFTARGTNIKELIYGSLSKEGLSPQPWEPREPGWGTHRIEYRAIDAAGNIGPPKAFRATVMPKPACTQTLSAGHQGELRVTSGVTCLDAGTVSGSIIVAAGASLVARGGRITGSVTAADAARVELVATTIEGGLRVSGTSESLIVFGSTVRAEMGLTNNRTATPPLVAGNTTAGPVTCTGNTTAPVNGGTANAFARGASGQCSGL